jgi:hypothetical protein
MTISEQMRYKTPSEKCGIRIEGENLCVVDDVYYPKASIVKSPKNVKSEPN